MVRCGWPVVGEGLIETEVNGIEYLMLKVTNVFFLMLKYATLFFLEILRLVNSIEIREEGGSIFCRFLATSNLTLRAPVPPSAEDFRRRQGVESHARSACERPSVTLRITP